MKFSTLLFIGLLAAAPNIAFANRCGGSGDRCGKQTVITEKQVILRTEMRKLWTEHVVWTRLYIVSSLANLPDAENTANRLLKNQTDIGNMMKTYYDQRAGVQLTALLKEHILIAADLIKAMKTRDTELVGIKKMAWIANADEIATLLNQANPDHFHLDEMKAMLHEHLDLTAQEVTARLTADFDADIAVYDQIAIQSLQMADHLSDGIIKQFPEQFD